MKIEVVVPARLPRHGTKNEYDYWGCRCSACRHANNVAALEWVANHRGQTPPKHGLNGYRSYGCRCDICAAAGSKASKGWRAARQARLEHAPHGTISGYFSWNCRCERCSTAARNYRLQRKASGTS